ncbi:unnamed protein product [Cyprideis torosa]|uniref:SKA complex subunit 1 n=1 Tax=Cyprideis torosa TaxID=163714 RepID=A0A7R8ZIV7_9CRUS|nr:unnamed protein product [Cyprideis torosa]CAG0885533.1 unnamed protein product [Cyprideis torosa]
MAGASNIATVETMDELNDLVKGQLTLFAVHYLLTHGNDEQKGLVLQLMKEEKEFVDLTDAAENQKQEMVEAMEVLRAETLQSINTNSKVRELTLAIPDCAVQQLQQAFHTQRMNQPGPSGNVGAMGNTNTIQKTESSTDNSFRGVPHIFPVELASFPRYLKGSLSCEKINGFIDVLNAAFVEKYKISGKRRNTIPPRLLKAYDIFKKTEHPLLKGKKFLCREDLHGLNTQLTIGKLELSMLTILKQRGNIKEERCQDKIVRYVLA